MAFSGSHCRCIPMLLSVTTRGIGLNLCSFYADAIRSSRNGNELPDINAVYRAMLAIIETKLMSLGLPPRNFDHVYDSSHRFVKINSIRHRCFWIPVILKRIIDAIGVITTEDEGVYFPVMSKNTEINVLLEESKLTIAQRQKSALKLRENEERKADSELLARMPLVRPRTSRRRSLSTIRESGIFDTDRYRPLKRGEDREKMKEKLANTMAYGDNQEQQQQPPPPIMKKPKPQLPTSKQMWNELVTQIRERTEWLAEMEYLGHADPHRDIIKDQIAERMRALDALGIDDSECSTPKSAASGHTLRYQEPEPIGQRRNSSVPSSRSNKSEKKSSARSTARAQKKEENVSSYSKLSPLQYSPRRRQ